MNNGFSPAAIELLRPQVEAIVDRILNLMGNTSEVDLMPAIAHPLPVSVIAELLGIPDTMQTQLTEWSDAIATFIGKPITSVASLADAFAVAMMYDADLFRVWLEILSMQTSPQELMARPGVLDRIMEIASTHVVVTPPSPSREQLLRMLRSDKRGLEQLAG
jgi:cytochrome P450